ncbi:MAG: sulfotransferase [Halioglobus sp.]
MPTENRPNLFIVGAQKSGTSALAGWLSQHPQVCMSFPKEPGYLAFGEEGYNYLDGYGKTTPASGYVVRDEATYLSLFAHATPRQRILAEASTWYFALPGTARKLYSFNPAARIMMILRDPVERAYSAWCHARSDQREPCANFSDALALESRRGEVEFLLRYRRMGLYSQALAEYRATFPEEQILTLFYDDLRANPGALWQAVCQFLAIDSANPPQFGHRYNRSGRPRNRWLHRALRSHPIRRALRPFVPHRFAIAVKQRLDDMNLDTFPAMDAQTRAELRQYYRADIEQLGRLTGRDLSAWLQ